MKRARILLTLVIGVLVFIGLTMTPIAILYIYPRFGRITDFVPVQDKLTFPGTRIIIEYGEVEGFSRSVTLRNLDSGQTETTYISSSPYQLSEYNVLSHNGSTYLLIRRFGGGSKGAHDYTVHNVTGSTIQGLGFEQSCVYPRLEGDTLQFEIALYCDWYPLNSGNARVREETIRLH